MHTQLQWQSPNVLLLHVPFPQLLGYSEKPVNLQMFIGTADDRYLRPQAFYQVHRITGKTVATASQEIIIASTKVLEIPLLPENNMSARYSTASVSHLVAMRSFYLLHLCTGERRMGCDEETHLLKQANVRTVRAKGAERQGRSCANVLYD